MRRLANLIPILLFGLLALPAGAQQPKLKLDSLGLPPFPKANDIGHIRLPLADILRRKPGEPPPIGPRLDDLAIQTYRTPLDISVDRIARFYLKYAPEGGWKLLDDVPESAASRYLVFWSPSAPGYLTVEIGAGPENTRQIDLTRLLGDVNPSRPGEVLRLTGKRVREQRAEIIYIGRFLNVKTNKLARQTLTAVDERSESGLGVESVQRLAPMDETYAVAIRVTDMTKQMTAVDVFSSNGTKIAGAESARPTGALTLLGKLRGAQGLTLRVVVMGPSVTPGTPGAPITGATLPGTPARPAPKTAPKAPVKPAKGKAKGATPKVAPKKMPAPAASSAMLLAAPPIPNPHPPMVLSEVYGLRPPLTALPEARRGGLSTKVDQIPGPQNVDVGSTCDAPVSRTIPWTADTKEEFSFSPDLFGGGFPRSHIGSRSGVLTVDFPRGSGTSNTYSINQTKTTSTMDVMIGYSYNGQWITLPSQKPNPEKQTYITVVENQPTVVKHSSGTCAPPMPPTTAAPPPPTPPATAPVPPPAITPTPAPTPAQ